jgi:T4-like virus Myoviridae tail sheath stabiliser
MANYFYDNQIRRFLIQFARIFSDWQVTKGKDPAGNDIIVRVPIQYGDSSRQASVIQANNSPSSLPSAPLITYYVTGLEYDQRRTQDPTFVDKMTVRRRAFNQDTQAFENVQGDAFTVERLMPVPYTLRINVDFWTTNYQQKLELIEQLGVLFNPSMEIQSTDNFIDWTSLSVVYQDGLTFSSRQIPMGSGNPIDIMNWKFYMPIWISASAKAKKMGVIHKIIASIFKGNAITDMQDDHLLLGTREKITPYGYKIFLINNTLQILPDGQPFTPPNSDINFPEQNPVTDIKWSAFLNVYGNVQSGISQIWLQNPYMTTDIVGTISLNPIDDRLLTYNIDVDTLPQNTLNSVNSIINPQHKGPDSGLPTATDGQRYLIIDSIGAINSEFSPAWGEVIANANDIIEYNGTKWNVSFNSQAEANIQFVTNLTTNVQYRYTDGVWVKSYEGWYAAGDFSVVI